MNQILQSWAFRRVGHLTAMIIVIVLYMYNHICWLKIILRYIFYNILSVRIITILIIILSVKRVTFLRIYCVKGVYTYNKSIYKVGTRIT